MEPWREMKKGEKYEKPYLNEVIFRINFANIPKLSENNKEAAKDFREKISKEFPNLIIKRNHEFNIGIDVDTGKPTQISQDGRFLWVYKNRKHDKSIELTSKSLILHYKKGAYTHFRDFLDDVILLIDAIKSYDPKDISFLGLRYINQIDGKTIPDLKECIQPKYFSDYVMDLDDEEEFIQIMNKVSIKKRDYILNLQYGLFNAAYPNPNFDKDFILDLDCTTKKVKEIDEVADELKQMNSFIWFKYDGAITDVLREEMNKEEEAHE